MNRTIMAAVAALMLVPALTATPAEARKRVSQLTYTGEVSFIPNPAGTWRKVRSCAHRLAAYFSLGGGLDKVSTWPQVYARTSGPCSRCVAVRGDQHHIVGILGPKDGGWEVVDFNSGGHKNRRYVVTGWGNYFFLNPAVTHSNSARRHKIKHKKYAPAPATIAQIYNRHDTLQ